jgi:mannose-6-phosphate isomerase-like protein (cupin superfamily)
VRHAFLLVILGAITLMRAGAQSPATSGTLAQRIVHTDPAAFRQLTAVHGGAGTMSFTSLLGRGAVTPEFNFLHRGVIPAGSGIGHHFHNVVEEMFVILDGEAQFTIDGRTASVKGPVGVLCRAGHSHAIFNPGPAPVQWMNLNVSLVANVYDSVDLGDTRAGATLDAIPTFMTVRPDQALLKAPGGPGRGAPAAPPPALAHETVGEAYYVLGGEGTINLAAESAAVRAGDAIAIRIGETSRFTNSGSAPLELLVMGVAKDMATKTQLLTSAPR